MFPPHPIFQCCKRWLVATHGGEQIDPCKLSVYASTLKHGGGGGTFIPSTVRYCVLHSGTLCFLYAGWAEGKRGRRDEGGRGRAVGKEQGGRMEGGANLGGWSDGGDGGRDGRAGEPAGRRHAP